MDRMRDVYDLLRRELQAMPSSMREEERVHLAAVFGCMSRLTVSALRCLVTREHCVDAPALPAPPPRVVPTVHQIHIPVLFVTMGTIPGLGTWPAQLQSRVRALFPADSDEHKYEVHVPVEMAHVQGRDPLPTPVTAPAVAFLIRPITGRAMPDEQRERLKQLASMTLSGDSAVALFVSVDARMAPCPVPQPDNYPSGVLLSRSPSSEAQRRLLFTTVHITTGACLDLHWDGMAQAVAAVGRALGLERVFREGEAATAAPSPLEHAQDSGQTRPAVSPHM